MAVSPVPELFDDATWTRLKAKWALDIKREAGLVREIQPNQSPGRRSGPRARYATGRKARLEAIAELFPPDA